MKNSKRVSLTQFSKLPKQLKNEYIILNQSERLNQLINILRKNIDKKIIIFFLTCDITEFFFHLIGKLAFFEDVLLFKLHGNMEQEERNKYFNTFRSLKKGGILVSTNVASRGLDIPNVKLIIQYDPPLDQDREFIHRGKLPNKTSRKNCKVK
jgi:superfamily II DNA/RNA helicase